MNHLKKAFGAIALTLAGSALAATQTINIFDGVGASPTANPLHANVAVDSDNRAHVTWAHQVTENGSARWNIFYKLLAADGSTLIDTTQLSSPTDDADKTFKPQITVSGTDTVYVAWHQSDDNVRLLGLNPAADDLSGDAATLATIQRFAETAIDSSTTGGNSTSHVYIDSDSTGRAHIVTDEQSTNDLYCGVYNADGSVSTAMTKVTNASTDSYGTASISIDLDSNDKMHIAFVTEGNVIGGATSNSEVAYMMQDCAAGSTLIDPTMVSSDDITSSMQSSLVVIDDKAYINWIDTPNGESGCSSDPCHESVSSADQGANTLKFIALDPSKDDQSGDAATLASITDSTADITTGQDLMWYPRTGVTELGNIQATFYAGHQHNTPLHMVDFDTAGAIVNAATEVANDSTASVRTSNTKANPHNRATAYIEGQTVQLVLRDIAVVPEIEPEVTPQEELLAKVKSSLSFGGSALGWWSLALLLIPMGLRRIRKTA